MSCLVALAAVGGWLGTVVLLGTGLWRQDPAMMTAGLPCLLALLWSWSRLQDDYRK